VAAGYFGVGGHPGDDVSGYARWGGQEPLFTYAWEARQGSLRRLGQDGSPDGTLTLGTIGRVRLAGMPDPNAIATLAVVPSGWVWLKDHTGWVPFGAEIVTLMREPAR
jgi:hypothetical protein